MLFNKTKLKENLQNLSIDHVISVELKKQESEIYTSLNTDEMSFVDYYLKNDNE